MVMEPDTLKPVWYNQIFANANSFVINTLSFVAFRVILVLEL